MGRRTGYAAIVIALAMTFALPISVAVAAAPGNDEATSPTIIASLPFADDIDVSEATEGSAEQWAWCRWGLQDTVYYGYTFSGPGEIRVDTSGSDFDTAIVAFEVMSFGNENGLSVIDCNDGALNIKSPPMFSNVLILIGREPWSAPGTHLVVNVDVVPPPANDDLGSAIMIDEFPYSTSIDPFLATWASDDPAPSCGAGAGPTVWYAMRPGDEEMLISAGVTDYEDLQAAVFTGSQGALTEVACDSGSYPHLDFQAEAGVTYYLMLKETQPVINPISLNVNTAFVADAQVTRTLVRPKTGIAVISGVLTCNKVGEGSVQVSLRQTTGRFSVSGTAGVSTPCTPEGAAWSVEVTPTGGPFVGGKASLDLGAYAWSSDQSIDIYSQQDVRLKGGH